MRTALFIIIIAIISAVAEVYLPWWTIAIVPFIAALVMNRKGSTSFIAGFLGIALFWLVAMLIKDIPNEHILSRRMAAVFMLPSYGLLMLIVTILGGLIGGLSAWAGGLLRGGMKHTH